jgi:hypothetical protein
VELHFLQRQAPDEDPRLAARSDPQFGLSEGTMIFS